MGYVSDGIVAQDGSQMSQAWAIREGITSALSQEGDVYKYDVSLPPSQFYDLVEVMRERVSGLAVRACGYGHLGDSNLHLNIVGESGSGPALRDAIEPFIYEYIAQHGGSISAEHGLGVMKNEKIFYSRSSAEVAIMQSVKGELYALIYECLWLEGERDGRVLLSSCSHKLYDCTESLDPKKILQPYKTLPSSQLAVE